MVPHRYVALLCSEPRRAHVCASFCSIWQTDYASQPSGFHSGKQAQKAKAGPAVNIALPVEKWALGKKVFDDPDELHWFIFDGKTIHVKSRPQDKESIISLQLSGHVKSVQVSPILLPLL